MPMDRIAIETGLLRKGFREKVGDHRFFIYHDQNGKKTSVRTKTSHGTGHRELNDGLVSLMAQQCRLTKKQFGQLIECPLSQAEYEKLLIAAGHIKTSIEAK
jgi:hypothetical protein